MFCFSRSTTPLSVSTQTTSAKATTGTPEERTTQAPDAGPPEIVQEDPDLPRPPPHHALQPEDGARSGLGPDPRDSQFKDDPYHLSEADYKMLPAVKTEESSVGHLVGASLGVVTMLSVLLACCICGRKYRG